MEHKGVVLRAENSVGHGASQGEQRRGHCTGSCVSAQLLSAHVGASLHHALGMHHLLLQCCNCN